MTLEELAQDKIVITIHGPYRPYATRNGPWSCNLEKSGHGIELKVRGEGPFLQDAIDAALKKWKASVSGIEEFSGPYWKHQSQSTTMKSRSEESPMHRSIKFVPGYDERPNYGQHSMEIHFVVRDDKYGALVWFVNPGWLPAKDQRQPFQSAGFNTHGYIVDPHVDESTCHDHCEYLDGEPCTAQFYSGYESQEALFSGFILNGEDWLWEKLEAFHAYFFTNGDKPL